MTIAVYGSFFPSSVWGSTSMALRLSLKESVTFGWPTCDRISARLVDTSPISISSPSYSVSSVSWPFVFMLKSAADRAILL